MNIVVCVKPVPDPEQYDKLRLDPVTKRLVREGIDSIVNPTDKNALEAGVEAIKAALVAGDKVQLVGFGTFAVNQKPAREGINPATKQKIKIAAKKVAKFKAGQEFADAINK